MESMGQPARRVGGGLVAFGISGLILTIVMTIVWLSGFFAAGDLDERLEADRVAMATALTDAAELMNSTATALESTSGSLGSVGAVLDDTARILDSLAATTAELADALDVSILGQEPFAAAAASLDEIAAELETFAAHADALGAEVETLEPDLATVAEDLRTVEASMTALATRVEAFSGVEEMVGLIRLYALLSALLSLWLAVLAAGCVWVGRQLRRAERASSSGASAAS